MAALHPHLSIHFLCGSDRPHGGSRTDLRLGGKDVGQLSFLSAKLVRRGSISRMKADKPLHLLEKQARVSRSPCPVLSDDKVVNTPLGAQDHSDRHVSRWEKVFKQRKAQLESCD